MVLKTKRKSNWKPDFTKPDPWEGVPEDYEGYVPAGHPRAPVLEEEVPSFAGQPFRPMVLPPLPTEPLPITERPLLAEEAPPIEEAPPEEVLEPIIEREFATEKQFQLLKKFLAEGTLSQKRLTRELYLTRRQAEELGYEVPEGQEFFRLSPSEAGTIPQPTILPPSPEEELLKRVFIDKFTPETAPRTVIEGLIRQAMENPQTFLSDLRERGKSADTIQLLQLLSSEPLSQDTIDSFFQGIPEITPEQQLLMKALPLIVKPRTIEWATKYFGDNPDKLRRNLITAGRNADTEALVRALYPEITDRGLKDYFSTASLAVEAEIREREKRIAEGKQGKFGRLFTAGVGDLVANVGGVLRWAGAEGIGEKITQAGQFMQVQAQPMEKGEFKWQGLFDPSSYSFQSTLAGLIRTTPTLMLLAMPSIGAFGLAGSVVTKLGLGAFSRAVITGIGGSALSRPLESAMEAAGAYDEARERGLSHEEATKAANSVFKKNLALVGTDIVQLTAAFAPTPFGRAGSIIQRGLVKTAQVGGKLTIIGLTEGGEEMYQDMLQRQARGEKFKMDADAQQVFAIGAIMGLGMGGGGDILMRVTDKVSSGFTPQQKIQFDTEVSKNKTKGLDDTQAKVQAMDKVVAANPDMAKKVEIATQEVNQELTQEQLAKIKAKAPEVTPPKPAGVAPTPTKGAVVAPEKVTPAPEVAELTADVWANMTTAQRLPLVRAKGLDSSRALVNWEGLTIEERSALTGKPEVAIPTGVTPKTWAEGILAIAELAKETQAVTAPKPSAKAIREAHKILGDIPVRQRMPKNLKDYINRIKNVNKKQYAQDYAEWVLKGEVDVAPRMPLEKLGFMAQQSVEMEIRDRLKAIAIEIKPEPAIPKAEAEAPAVAEVPVGEVAPPSPLLSTPEETTLPMPDKVTVSEDRVVLPPPPPKEPPPPEPPPTHPPQPAPIEAGRITMPDLQAPQLVVDMYSKPDFWRRIGNLPLVRKAVGLFDPWAIANDPAHQAVALRATLKDEGAQKAQAVMSHLWEIGTQERVWGKTDEYGYLKAEQFAGFTIDDIRTNPTKFLAEMTEQQREWIKRASEIEKIKLEALKRNGVDINELSFEDGGEYAGRRVMGKFNDAGELIESGRIGIGGRVGAKMPFEKTRVFKTAEEGILANYRYMNTDEALYYNTLGAYFKIADRQMADWILSKVDWRTTKAPEALVLQAEAARLRLRKAQQLAAALNRAVRGERVPSNTINSIATVFPDQADTLKNLIPELQKPSPETADTVQILTAEAKALISEARLEYYQAVNERARAREEAMRVKYEEASIAHPAFAGKIFTSAEAKEIADILNRGLTPQFIEALGEVNKVNAIGRFFMLAGDVSPMAIQLQFLAFYRPAAYAKAIGGFVRAMFDPEFQYRYYANNRDLINRHPTLILSGRGTEFTEFMGRGGLGKKLGVLAKPLVPFQKAFEGSLDVAGIELAKSLDHLATTAERTLEVDQFINEFRGITSSARIGVSSTQRQVETAIFLAPRYNRAIATYLFDIVHGGVRGELARMSLAQGLAGLSAMAVAISIALGEDDDEIWQHFDPRSPKFFTWDVAGVKIGLGGKVRSILKTFGNMLRTGEVGQPALNFLRGNLSPGASTGLDLLTGKNYIGEPTRDNVLDFTKTVGRNFMMIWTQTFLMEGGTLKDKAIIATAEFLGLRGYDISAKKELKIKDLEELLGETIGKTPVLTKKKPDIWDTRNMYSAVKRILERERPEDVLADKGYAGWGHLVVKIQQSEANSLPNIAFKDYNFDKEKGDTLADYMEQWAERQRIIEAGERAVYVQVKIVEGKEERTTFKGLQALVAHKVDYPNAQRGNLSKRDRELLLEYNAAVDKKQFIKDYPEIKVNKLTAWLKAHPRENAELALVGQADILSKEAYNQYKKLIVEMDITDAALLKNVLPPETSLDTHFSYVDMVAKGIHGSWEAQLLLKQDALKAKEGKVQSYVEWRTKEGEPLKLSDTPIASLDIKTIPEYHEIWNKLKKEDYPDYVGNLDDKIKDKDGLTARDRAIAELKATKIGDMTWIDLNRKVDAIEKGTDENPIDEKLVKAHVDYGKLIDKEGIGSSSAEAMLFRVDNPDYDAFRTDTTIWDNQALTPIDQSRIPIWRIDVKYRKEDAQYQKILDDNDGDENSVEAKAYLARQEAYRKDRRRRDAYKLSNSLTGERFPLDQIESYVGYMEILDKPGVGSSSAETMLYRVDNLPFNEAMIRIKGLKPVDESKIREWRIEVEFKDLFDEHQNILDTTEDLIEQNAKIQELFAENPAFQSAYYRHAGYKLDLSEEHTDSYVTYMLMPEKGWAKERYLKLHPEFYEEIKRKKGWKTDYKWDEIPSEEVEKKWFVYDSLVAASRKYNYRLDNPDLDAWLVLTGKVTRLASETERRKGLTARERYLEDIAARQSEFEKKIAELRKKLGGL